MEDTKPENTSNCCSRCGETKNTDKFLKNRNICKSCDNLKRKQKYHALEINDEIEQDCSICNNKKSLSSFIKNKNFCKECNNNKRRTKYETDEDHRKELIKQASDFKHKKVVEKAKLKEIQQEEIGQENKICKYCQVIQPNTRFRHNRLKCKDCERDEPVEKFNRSVRSRIHMALIRKTKHTIKYLGCNTDEYITWITNNDFNYTIENHGNEWHIDHVIPLSKFNLEDEQQQSLAFNWRNTMPLSVKENLSKNNKILIPQIEQHMNKLIEYHKELSIEMPKEFIDLFAKHLVAGSS